MMDKLRLKIKSMVKSMDKLSLKEMDDTFRYYIKEANKAADKALARGDEEEVDRLEDLIKVLYDIDTVVYYTYQNMRQMASCVF